MYIYCISSLIIIMIIQNNRKNVKCKKTIKINMDSAGNRIKIFGQNQNFPVKTRENQLTNQLNFGYFNQPFRSKYR